MLKRNQSNGNTSYEYAVIGGLVAVACITPLFFLGGTISTGMQDTNAKASVGIDNLTNLLSTNNSAQSSLPAGPNFQISYNASSGAVVVNTNGMNIVGAPATAGTGTTLATYVYGALITKLSNTPPPGLAPNSTYLTKMRALGEAIKALAERSNVYISQGGCNGVGTPHYDHVCNSEFDHQFADFQRTYKEFSQEASKPGYSQYADLTSTVTSAGIFSNQLFGFGILQSLSPVSFSDWANNHGTFNTTGGPNALGGQGNQPPDGFGNPPPPVSALMIDGTGGKVIDLSSSSV